MQKAGYKQFHHSEMRAVSVTRLNHCTEQLVLSFYSLRTLFDLLRIHSYIRFRRLFVKNRRLVESRLFLVFKTSCYITIIWFTHSAYCGKKVVRNAPPADACNSFS